jgi:Sulfotransferase domain
VRLPNAVIAGVNKAGTTSLFHALASHPDVAPSKVKETHFFDPIKYGDPPPPLEAYAGFFPRSAAAPVVLEATPGYFYGGAPLARALGKALPQVKIVVILREPGERAFSWWRFCRSGLLLDPDLSFGEYLRLCAEMTVSPESAKELVAWRGLSGGMYSRYLPHWQEVFGDRLLVLFHDELLADPVAAVGRVCGHLDIPAMASVPRRRDNVTTDVDSRALHKAAMQVNRLGERLWRAAPQVKSTLRSAYYRVNARKDQDRLDPVHRAWLTDYFESDLAALRGMFADRESLPAWLTAP